MRGDAANNGREGLGDGFDNNPLENRAKHLPTGHSTRRAVGRRVDTMLSCIPAVPNVQPKAVSVIGTAIRDIKHVIEGTGKERTCTRRGCLTQV